MSDLDYWINVVQSLAPAIISVIGVITSMIISIHKITCHSRDFVDQTKRMANANVGIEAELGQIITDNAKLRTELAEIKGKLDKVHVKKGKE